jgi:hypothetical protein
MAFTIATQGSFVSTGVGIIIPTPQGATYFRTINYTQMNLQGTVCVGGEWFNGISASNDGIKEFKVASNVINKALFSSTTPGASAGFTYVTQYPTVGAVNLNAITGITAANPAVVTQTNTYSNGNILRLYNTTGMLQIGGMDFQISSVSGSGYTLLGLPATASNGFATAGTAGNTRLISNSYAVAPQYLYITNISQALNAVVTTSVDPSPFYVVGQEIYFSVPPSFGMTNINGLTGTIIAVNAVAASGNIGAYNLTVNINSSAFNAFAFPASTLSPTAQLFATLAPAGQSTQYNPVTMVQTGYNFLQAPFHTAQITPYMYLAGGAQSPAGSNLDTIIWQCYHMENM